MKKSPSALLAVFVTILLIGVPLAFLLNNEKLISRDLSYENSRLTAELAAAEEARSSQEGEMLFYDLNGLDVTATSKEVAFTDLYTVEGLKNLAADCSDTVEEGYFENLLTTFADVKGMEYTFTSNQTPSDKYTVTAFPNAANYKDFATLMFASACGGGYDETPPLACADIEAKLQVEFN